MAMPLSVIFAFPNEYSVGITSLGYQVVWATLARRADVDVARLFTDCHEPLPTRSDLLGFSLSWELDYRNLLTLLESLDIPRRAADRQNEHPLVFGGRPGTHREPRALCRLF